MARIFFSLAVFAVLLLAANIVVGLTMGDFNAAAQRYQRHLRETGQAADEGRDEAAEAFAPIRRQATIHMLLGLGAALVTILVNSITVTYFIGTSRWCREVSETYSLGPELAARSAQLKRQAFPWSLAGILVTLAIVALGAASDPSANSVLRAADWVPIHFFAATLGTLLIAWAFLRQMVKVGANYEVIEAILAKVRQIREEKGWDE